MNNLFLIFLIPHLISFLLLCQIFKKEEGSMDSWNYVCWQGIISLSILWPLGILLWFIFKIGPILTKEIKLQKIKEI